jgi:DNA-binding HxlR family transcriptional regulator
MAAQPYKPVRGSRSGRPIMALLDLLGERWTLRILWELRAGEALSFRELRSTCGDLSPTVLNKRLHELREAQIISLNEGYQLTEEGQILLEALLPLNEWAERWAKRVGQA